MKKGDEADAMFFIISGEVEVYVDTEIVKLRPGDFFGETGILRNSIRTADVVSQTECQLLELQKIKFTELVRIYPDLGVELENVMRDRMGEETDITTEVTDS